MEPPMEAGAQEQGQSLGQGRIAFLQLYGMSTTVCNALAATITAFQIDHDPAPKGR